MKDYRSCLLNIAMSERPDCSCTLPSDAAVGGGIGVKDELVDLVDFSLQSSL